MGMNFNKRLLQKEAQKIIMLEILMKKWCV